MSGTTPCKTCKRAVAVSADECPGCGAKNPTGMSEFSPEMREAIRTYMAHVIVLPGFVVAVLMFALGYFVNTGARGAAMERMLPQISGLVITLADSTSGLADRAAGASESADLALNDITEARDNATSILQEIDSLRQQAVGGEVVEEVAGLVLDQLEGIQLALGREYVAGPTRPGNELHEVDLGPTSGRFCFLTAVGGDLDSQFAQAGVRVVNGRWLLVAQQERGGGEERVMAAARCLSLVS